MEISKNALVSVVMCTYNGEKFLDEQIQSIIEQTYDNIELIIVDDLSSDSTLLKAEKWQLKYPEKIRVYCNEKNIGYNANFANALNYANGEYIAISDQDDVWLTNKIEEQVNCLNSDPEIILVHHKEEKIVDGKIMEQGIPLIQWNVDFRGSNFRRFVLINVISGHLILFRRSLLNLAKPFPLNNDYGYDYWLATIATLFGRIEYIYKVLCYHRLHESNAWFSTKSEVKSDDETYFFKNFLYKRLPYLKSLPLNGMNQKFINDLETILITRSKNENNLPLLIFLIKNRKNIFPVKSKFRIFEEYAYLKRCLTFYKKK